jgi:hypothetical protein
MKAGPAGVFVAASQLFLAASLADFSLRPGGF